MATTLTAEQKKQLSNTQLAQVLGGSKSVEDFLGPPQVQKSTVTSKPAQQKVSEAQQFLGQQQAPSLAVPAQQPQAQAQLPQAPQQPAEDIMGISKSFILSNPNQAIADFQSKKGLSQQESELLVKNIQQGKPAFGITGDVGGMVELQLQQQNAQLDALKETFDQQTQGVIDNIQQTFQRRKDQTEALNKAVLGSQSVLGVRSGRQRFAPEIQTAVLSKEESDGIQRLTDLDNQEKTLILQAEQANSANDFKILNQKFNNILAIQDAKRQAAIDLQNASIKNEQIALQKAQFAQEQFQFEQQQFQQFQEQAQQVAGFIAPSLVSVDAQGNLVEPTEDQINALAQEANIDPFVLQGAVAQQLETLQDKQGDDLINELNIQLKKATLAQKLFDLQQDQAGPIEPGGAGAPGAVGVPGEPGFAPSGIGPQTKFLDATGQPAELTVGQVNVISDSDATLKQIDTILELLKSEEGIETGPIASKLFQAKKFTGAVGADDPNLKLESLTEQLKASFIKFLSGVAAGEAEVKRLEKFLPDFKKQEGVIEGNLNTLKDQIASKKGVFLETLGVEENPLFGQQKTFSSVQNFLQGAEDDLVQDFQTFVQQPGLEDASSEDLFQFFKQQKGLGFNQPLGTGLKGTDVSKIKDFSQVQTTLGAGTATGIKSGSSAWKPGFDFVLKGGKGAKVTLPFAGVITQIIGGFANKKNSPLSKKQGKSQNGGFGNQVKIQLPDGSEVWFSHLESVAGIKAGQQVSPGTFIGTQGNTGLTLGNTGTHLDITIKKAGAPKKTFKQKDFLSSQEVASLFNTKLT